MRKWNFMVDTETAIVVEANSREGAKAKLIQMGIDPDRFDYLLEYKPLTDKKKQISLLKQLILNFETR